MKKSIVLTFLLSFVNGDYSLGQAAVSKNGWHWAKNKKSLSEYLEPLQR